MAMDEPPPATQRYSRVIRISRGATARATDGALGAVHQIIMSQRTGELQALVIATYDGQRLELPAIHVLRVAEEIVYLDFSLEDLRLHPELATPYNAHQYVPVRVHPVLSPQEASRHASISERPLVTNVERDAIGVVVPDIPHRDGEQDAAPQDAPQHETFAAIDSNPNASDTSDTPDTPEATESSLDDLDTMEIVDTMDTESESVEASSGGAPIPDDILVTSPREGGADGGLAVPAEVTADLALETAPVAMESVMAGDMASDTAIGMESGTDVTVAHAAWELPAPVMTPDDSVVAAREMASGQDIAGLESMTDVLRPPDVVTDMKAEDEEEGAYMEGSSSEVNQVTPGVTSSTIHNNENTISEVLDESQHAYTQATPPGAEQREWIRQRLTSTGENNGSRLTWLPAAALGALIVGIAVWSTLRAIRRGRRKAVKAARNARISAESLRTSVRDTVRGAGKSATDLAQTVRVGAQEITSKPRETAADALSTISEIPARYRWFRRGMRVGAQTARFSRK